MTDYLPAYRLTVYGPRSLDVTEATILVPSTNAATTQAFQVATLSSMATLAPTQPNWYPYMGLPTGRRGRMDPLSKAVDVGEFTVPILDARLNAGSTDNATRWVSAFTGNSAGEPQLMGLKAKIEESLDGGSSWSAYFTGRVSDLKLQNRLQYVFTLRDMSESLKVPIFVSLPSTGVLSPGYGVPSAGATSCYTQALSLLPIGLPRPYSTSSQTFFLSTGLLKASIGPAINDGFANAIYPWTYNGVQYHSVRFQLSSTSRSRIDNVVTNEFGRMAFLSIDAVPALGGFGLPATLMGNQPLGRIHIEYGPATSAIGELEYEGAWVSRDANYPGSVYRVQGFMAHELRRQSSAAANPPGYVPCPTSSVASINFYAYAAQGALAGSQFPLLIGDVHPVQLLQDVLGGHFGYLWQSIENVPAVTAAGQPKWSIPVNAAVFATMIADQSYPPARVMIAAADKLDQWITKNILQPYQIGYYFDGLGQFTPVDLRPPSVIPSNIITDADLVEGQQPGWEHSRDSAVLQVTANHYQDFPRGDMPTLLAGGNWPTAGQGTVVGVATATPRTVGGPYPSAVALFDAYQIPDIYLNIGAADVQGTELTFDFPTLRGAVGERFNGKARLQFLSDWVGSVAQGLAGPFGRGAQTFALTCRRTANTDLWPGSYTLVQVTNLVDPGTNLRGGVRLGLVVERTEQGVKRVLKLLDLGLNIIAQPPTVGNVTQQTNNTAHGITVGLGFNANAMPVEVNYAVSSSGILAPPATSDASWSFGGVAPYTTVAAPSVTIGHFAGGATSSVARVWVRARSRPGSSDLMHQPSSWIPASSNGFVDLAPILAPSALATSSLSGADAAVTFTPGDYSLRTQVSLVSPSGGTLVPQFNALPGTARVVVHNLIMGSSYQMGLQHVDEYGGGSGVATISFTAATSALTLPAMAYFAVQGIR